MTDSTKDNQSNNGFFGSLRGKLSSSKKDTNHEKQSEVDSIVDAVDNSYKDELVEKKEAPKYKGMKRDEIFSAFEDDLESLDVAGKARFLKFMDDIDRQRFDDPKDKYDAEYNQYFMDKLVTEVFLIKPDDLGESQTFTLEQNKQHQCDRFLRKINAEIQLYDGTIYKVTSPVKALVEYAALDLQKRGFKVSDVIVGGDGFKCDVLVME